MDLKAARQQVWDSLKPVRKAAEHGRAVCATNGCNEPLELGWELDAGLCVTCWFGKTSDQS